MSNPTLKSPFPSFRSDDDGSDVPLPKPKSLKKSATSGKGHPNSVSRALKYAHQIYGGGSNATKAAAIETAQNNNISPLMPREDLAGALYEAKKRCKLLELNTASLKAESHRYESEIAKQQRRIEKLLESSAPQSQLPPTAEVRREIEKSQLVRQLKTQITNLRNCEAEKDIEIETLKRSQKGTKLVELSNEKEEYYLETLRLKQIVRELREALQNEKQKRVFEKKRNGAGEEIRQEVARLTSGYQNILKGINPGQLHSNTSSKSKALPNSNGSPHHASKRPQLSNKSKHQNSHGNSHNSHQNNSSTLFHTTNSNGPESSAMTSNKHDARLIEPIKLSSKRDKEGQKNALFNNNPDESGPDELDFFNGVSDGNDGMMMMTSVQEKDKKEDKNDLNIQNHNSEFEILENNETLLSEKVRVFISKIETAELPDVERKADDENDVFILMSFEDIWDTNTNTMWEGGSDISWSFNPLDPMCQNMQWHASLTDLREGFLKVVAMDENKISASKYIGEGKTKLNLPKSFSGGFGVVVGTIAEMKTEIPLFNKENIKAGYISVTLNLISVLSSVNFCDSDGNGNFDSQKVSEKSMNSNEVNNHSGPKFSVGDVIEGRYKGEDVWYSAMIKGVNKIIDTDTKKKNDDNNNDDNNVMNANLNEIYTYHVLYDDGDEELSLLEDQIRAKFVPDSNAVYTVGENVEALFGRGEEWYKAKISSITDGGTYNLYYEDGDEEDDVSVGRIRGLPSKQNTMTSNNANFNKNNNNHDKEKVSFSLDKNKESSTSYNNDVNNANDNQYQTEITPRNNYNNTDQDDIFLISTEDHGHKHGSVKSQKLDESLGSSSTVQRRPSLLKSSEEAFLTNYLDELSDDDDDAPGDLSSGPAVYGNVDLIDHNLLQTKNTINNEIDEINGESKVENENDKVIIDGGNEDKNNSDDTHDNGVSVGEYKTNLSHEKNGISSVPRGNDLKKDTQEENEEEEEEEQEEEEEEEEEEEGANGYDEDFDA